MDEVRKRRAARTGPYWNAVVAGGAWLLTVALGVGLSMLFDMPPGHALIAAIVTALAGGGVLIGLTGLRDDQSCATAPQHESLEKLAEQLALATSKEEVVSQVERHVRQALPCDEASFVPSSPGCKHPSDTDTDGRPSLTIRSIMHGRPVASLRVSRAPGLTFSEHDASLLRAIIVQSSIALVLIARATKIDQRRRQQAEAWEGERAAIIEALAAEIAHEVRYPINFFRTIFANEGAPKQLDEEDIDIGCEEVERLERLVTGLRKVAVRRLERRRVRVSEIIARAEVLLRDRLDGRTFSLSVPETAQVRCDPDQITQVLVNLMSNAVSATKNGEDLGIDWKVSQRGAELVVWDDGPGFVCPPAMIFTPWFTTKSTGTGLGLAITHRIVRAHGWAVDPSREEGRTKFSISVPAADVVAGATTAPAADASTHPADGPADGPADTATCLAAGTPADAPTEPFPPERGQEPSQRGMP